MADIVSALSEIVGATHVVAGESVAEEYTHDEALTASPVRPEAVVRPATTDEVSRLLALCDEQRIPVTARGAGTGLSGAAISVPGGVLVSFERMDAIVEIDTENQVAVVQPGVTLDRLDAALKPCDLVYPVFPGEYSASLGGNVATNAGGMRAVKYGVTRHQVLGVEAVLANGDVIRTGGKFVKATSGYDLTQIIVGSEGTLAFVTEAVLKLHPRLPYAATVLAPFRTLDEITAAVPRIMEGGIGPMIVEYIDTLTMAAMSTNLGLDLGVPQEVKDTALAYLVVVLEQRVAERLDEDVEALAEQIGALGAIDVYVLPPGSATKLIEGREKAFWMAKAAGADDILDMVVPRAAIPEYMAKVAELAGASGSWVAGCGHAGDGNVHLGVFQRDPDVRHALIHSILEGGMALGGAISGEHGIGTEKKSYFLELEDPAKLALLRRIKAAFDPNDILNPGKIFERQT